METNQRISQAAIARLLSNPELTDEQRDVYKQLSRGEITDSQAIEQVMQLEQERNQRENATTSNPATA